jgi:hypothetical protein
MEKLTALGLDFNKILITLLIPGFTATIPWITYVMQYYYYDISFIIDNNALLITLVSMLCLIVGLLIENIGSRLEVIYYDKRNGSTDIIWKKYLSLNYNGIEPIGQRYIRTILLRMKFETSFGISLIFLSGGLLFYDCNVELIENIYYKIAFLYLLPILLATYLLFIEGYSSSKVLADTRKTLVEKYDD